MVRDTIILTRREVADQIDLQQIIPDIQRCFAEFEKGRDLLPSKYIIDMPGGISACMFGYTRATHMISMKVGQERAGNRARGLPTIFGVINLFDPDTGELLMIVDSLLATYYRTAAAATVAANHLARKNSATLAVIGAGGALGREMVRALASMRSIRKVFLVDVRQDAAQRVADELASQIKADLHVVDAETACRQADIIGTATTSRTPIVQDQWIRPGTHLSCMGADLPEKIEVEPALLRRSRLIADHCEHCLKRGEVSQAVAAGELGPDCFAGSLGQVINGDVPGRQSDEQITLFDGLGLGVQDTTVAKSIYDQALAKNLGTRVRFND